MNLVRYNPHRKMRTDLDTGSRLFDDLFDDFFGPFAMAKHPVTLKENVGLKVDIYEKDDAIVIDAELPGVEKENISVDLKGRQITLGGERKSDEEVKEEHRYRRESRYGKFERSFSLPFEVNSENVKANFKNGILKLEITKPAEEAPKKITIN